MHKELPAPKAAREGEQSIEVLRVWLIDGKSHVSLLPMIFEDPAVWGILLADAAQHVALARHEIQGDDRLQTIARLLAALQRELATPSEDTAGAVRPPEGEPPQAE